MQHDAQMATTRGQPRQPRKKRAGSQTWLYKQPDTRDVRPLPQIDAETKRPESDAGS